MDKLEDILRWHRNWAIRDLLLQRGYDVIDDEDGETPKEVNPVQAKTALKQLISEAEIKARREELLWVASLDPAGNWKQEIDNHLKAFKQGGVT